MGNDSDVTKKPRALSGTTSQPSESLIPSDSQVFPVFEDMTDACFQEYVTLIHDFTGITLAGNRKAMLQGRLRKRLRELKLVRCEDYLAHIRANPNEKETVIDLVTTNETRFFRTPRIWDYLQQEFIPKWYTDHPHQIFRAWSAAASSGEEAHSLAIICQDFKETHPDFQYQILGTDISQEMVDLCTKGVYREGSLDIFQKTRTSLFSRYMHKDLSQENQEPSYRASLEVRAQIRFRRHNLFEELKPTEVFDLILLRNVLIYFVRSDQEKVLARLRPNLTEDGRLVIGESESLAYVQSDFSHFQPLIYSVKIELGEKVA